MSLARPAIVDDLLNYRLSCLLDRSGAMIIRLCEGRYGITRREWRLVALIAAHGAMSPSELAERAHLERARTSRLITELVDKKLITKLPVAGDGRRALLALSEEGRALYDELFPQSVQLNNSVLAALTREELEVFDRALEKLTLAAEQQAAVRPVPDKADRRHGGARKVRR